MELKRTEYMQGFVPVYTGNGKGKTTAAIGLAIRAAGAGLKVFIGQFIKTGDFSELKPLKRLSLLPKRCGSESRYRKVKESSPKTWSMERGKSQWASIPFVCCRPVKG
jgi:ATP:corrinoid adenosyltransferase